MNEQTAQKYQALEVICAVTRQPWEYSECYNAMALHTPDGYYLLTSDYCDCPEIDTLDDLMLGFYKDHETLEAEYMYNVDKVTNIETLAEWASLIRKDLQIGICDYCENVTEINSEGWCAGCSPSPLMNEDGRCSECRDYARDCQC